MTHTARCACLVLASASLVVGCFYTTHTGWRWSERDAFARIVSEGTDCYVTEQGVLVQAVGGGCPDRADVERETLRILDDSGADPGTLMGYVMVFSAKSPQCNHVGGCDGMTDGNFAVVHYLDWPRVMRHEMFHVILQAELGYSDSNHFDLRWRWHDLLPEERRWEKRQ